MPKHTEKPIMGLQTNKNFIVSNAVENILARYLFTIFFYYYLILFSGQSLKGGCSICRKKRFW